MSYELQEDQSINIPELIVSYAVSVCNEIEEIQILIPHLLKHKRPQDEIVVIFDSVNGSNEVEKYLRSIEPGLTYSPIEKYPFRWYGFDFHNNFSELKNEQKEMCRGNFIFSVDADEIPNEGLMKNIHWLIDSNKEVDLFLVPRENFVVGITKEYIEQNRWVKDELDRINYPDFQTRIYRNVDNIKWVNRVHERLDGFKKYAYLPTVREYNLNHTKTFERQIKQNNYYNTLT